MVILIVLSRLISHRLPRHAILFADPLAEINELAALRTKRPERIILPLDPFVAGWTLFHEPELSAGFQLASGDSFTARNNHSGRLTRIRLFTNSIVPSRRIAFKRTVTLSRVDPTMEAISR
jgi:hypothetical protein